MKALSIANPYPAYILDPVDELPVGITRKRTENRTWEMLYRGPLLIHASKSRGWLKTVRPEHLPATMAFGFIVGVVDVVACLHVSQFARSLSPQWSWVPQHQHASGPFCIILENPRKFISPIPYKGAQGLFNVPESVVAEQLRKAEA